MPGKVVCKGCGIEFEAKRIDRVWCDDCREKNLKKYQGEYDERKKSKCQDCGREIGRRAIRCHICDNKARSQYYLKDRNPNWQGGFTRTAEGYVYRRVKKPGYKGHPYRAEHIIVWQETHKKKLPKGWVIHHLNGIKDDNRPENLLALSRGAHHKHPFPSIAPYQQRIRELEKQVRELQQLHLNIK